MALFITFEGLDGSGKSTHLRRAGRWLEERDLDVRMTHEPGGSPLGDAIRSVFLDRRWGEIDGMVEALLVFASRRQHLLEVIEPALAAGRNVLCDRFTDSSLAYQGSARGLPWPWIEKLDRLATGGRRPDHTLLFDLAPEAAFERRRSSSQQPEPIDRLDAESLKFYCRVYDGYQELVKREPQRIRVIDSSGPMEQTWQAVERTLNDIFGPAVKGTSAS